MTRLLTILLCVLGLTTRHTISENGVDNLIIGKASLTEVTKAFPNGTTIVSESGGKTVPYSVHFRDGTTKQIKIKPPKQSSITYTLADKGISFYFAFDHKLNTITIWNHDDFVTDKGIMLGKSTFKDLETLYGKSQWGYSFNHQSKKYVWVKSYDNMFFESADTSTVKLSDTLTIDRIYICEK